MRAPCILLTAALSGSTALTAQWDSLPAFNSVRTPASPAFVLLGVEPTSVERPNTPSELAVSVLNSMNQLASLPRDFALEASPFWLLAHPTLTWRNDATRTPLESVLRTGTISIATAQRGSTGAPVTGLSIAARLSLVSGKMSPATRGHLEVLENRLNALAKRRAEIEAPLRAAADSTLIAALRSAKGDSARLEQARVQHESAIALVDLAASQDPRYTMVRNAVAEEFQDFAVQREGLAVELAGGVVWDAANQVFDSVKLKRWGAWLTPSYQRAGWSIVGVGRYLAVDTTGGFNTLDLGARIIRTTRSLALSTEYVGRYFLGGGAPPHQHRLAGVLEYQVGEGLWVTGTFGKGYDSHAPSGLLAKIGLSFDFSRKRFAVP